MSSSSFHERDLEKGDLNPQKYETPNNANGNPVNQVPTEDSNLERVLTSVTSDGDIIYFGKQAFHRNELLSAFGGEFRTGLHPVPHIRMGNPVPLGLAGYAICTFLLGMIFVQARDAKNPQILASAGMFLGGALTMICGLWCLIVENTFAATVLGSFGGFYMTYAGFLIDSFGIAKAYANNPNDFNSVMGFFLIAWFFFGLILWWGTLKSNWSISLLVGFITMFLFLNSLGFFLNSTGLKKAAGVFAILSSFAAFFAIFEGIATPQNSYFQAPALLLPGAQRV